MNTERQAPLLSCNHQLVLKSLALLRRLRLKKREGGQGIVEYFSILAFVALLIATVFGIANGTLYNALSQSCSRMVAQMDRLNNEAYMAR